MPNAHVGVLFMDKSTSSLRYILIKCCELTMEYN
jgi:hypothetical protein